MIVHVCFFSPAAAGPGGQQPPAPGGAQGADVQAQWAEYYRQLGQAYYGGQPGQPGEQPPPEQKVCLCCHDVCNDDIE